MTFQVNYGCSNRLSWVSEKEASSKSFEVEISNDGRNFNTLASINAAGNSGSPKNYTYTDINPVNGDNYYRLKMIDIDGKFVYSKVLKTNINCDRRSIKIHPNPVMVNNNLTVIIDGYSGTLKGELMDVAGKVIRTYVLKNGTNTVQIADMAQATYLLRVTEESGGAVKSFPVIVIR
jgi:hypothetical protein